MGRNGETKKRKKSRDRRKWKRWGEDGQEKGERKKEENTRERLGGEGKASETGGRIGEERRKT